MYLVEVFIADKTLIFERFKRSSSGVSEKSPEDTPDEERLKRSKISVFICNKDFNKVHVSFCCSPPFVYIYIYIYSKKNVKFAESSCWSCGSV